MEENLIANVANEVLFVGSFFKKPDLYIEYGRYIKSKYDLSDLATRFFYELFETYYTTFSQNINESKVNAFVIQDNEMLKSFRRYGGYKTIQKWMTLADAKDFKSYFETAKKYSLLREFDRKGYNVDKIMAHPKFNKMGANDIYRVIRSGADKIGTVIMVNEDSIIATEHLNSNVKNWILKPSVGLTIPFQLINAMFRGMRKGKFICLGFLSNEGKTRLAIYLSAYIAFVENQKVAFFANETDEDDFKACLLTTVINNKCFKKCHGIEITKVERQIVLGQYLDDNGNFISRKTNEKQEFIETEDDYYNRLIKTSTEFRNVLKVGEWLESNKNIHYKFMKDYSDEGLEFEIRKHKLAHGINYFIYDTMKGWKDENWSVLKQTATFLSSLMLELKTFMWADIQLTDDSLYTDVFELSSNNIANAKQLKHVIDHLLLGKRIAKDEYHKYAYRTIEGDWGNTKVISLDPSKVYYGIKCDKNRGGDKSKLPLLEVDLNKNTWTEVGYLVKGGK